MLLSKAECVNQLLQGHCPLEQLGNEYLTQLWDTLLKATTDAAQHADHKPP